MMTVTKQNQDSKTKMNIYGNEIPFLYLSKMLIF